MQQPLSSSWLVPSNPDEQCREYRSAEDDPERALRQIGARRLLCELPSDEFKLAVDQREVGSRLIGLTQRELALICHINRHQRSTFANPRNSRNLKRCPLASNEWLTAVLA